MQIQCCPSRYSLEHPVLSGLSLVAQMVVRGNPCFQDHACHCRGAHAFPWAFERVTTIMDRQQEMLAESVQSLNPEFRTPTIQRLDWPGRGPPSRSCYVFLLVRCMRWCAPRSRWEFWQSARTGQDQSAGKRK